MVFLLFIFFPGPFIYVGSIDLPSMNSMLYVCFKQLNVASFNYFTIQLHQRGRFRCNIGLVPKMIDYMDEIYFSNKKIHTNIVMYKRSNKFILHQFQFVTFEQKFCCFLSFKLSFKLDPNQIEKITKKEKKWKPKKI